MNVENSTEQLTTENFTTQQNYIPVIFENIEKDKYYYLKMSVEGGSSLYYVKCIEKKNNKVIFKYKVQKQNNVWSKFNVSPTITLTKSVFNMGIAEVYKEKLHKGGKRRQTQRHKRKIRKYTRKH